MSEPFAGRKTTLATTTREQIADLRKTMSTGKIAAELGVSRTQARWWGLDEQQRQIERKRNRQWRP